ncbi:lipopolysaccharide biosynthesis protein [Vallicoccus soli]|uniref:lipopolysaccharide biosynthesis protein n=1 Tax=Vallicoccus soli TaxID=2339232 RepID=UPI0014035197|nr:polysaccharide biosynthesis C-terminal domain-containing protein [Vallicoccus soli]
MSAPPLGGAAPAGTHVERAARSGALSLAGALVSAVAGVALTAVVTNGFDRATAGTVFALTSLFLIVTGVVQLGTEVGLVRALPVALVRGEPWRVRAVLRTALVPVAVLSLVAAAAGVLLDGTVAGLAVPGTGQEGARQVLVLALALPAAALLNAALAATRGLRTMRPTVVVEALGRSVVQLAAVAAVAALGLGPVAAVAAWSLPYALALVAAALWLAALLRRRARGRPPEGAAVPGPRAEAGEFWRFTAPRALGTVSQVLLKRADVVLVAALRSPAEAALYAAATRFVVLGQLGVQALQQSLSPQLAALFAAGDTAGVREVYRAATAWSMMLAWPVYLACAVLAPELLTLFGEGYDEVAPVVVVLCTAMLAATACGAVDTVLLMSGGAWRSLANNSAALVVNLVLNVVLIPRYGAVGAGAAWAASILLRNALPLVQVWTLHRISPLGRQTAVVGLSAGLLLGVVPALVRWATGSGAVVLGALVVGGLVHLLVLARHREELQLAALAGALRRRGARAGRGRG